MPISCHLKSVEFLIYETAEKVLIVSTEKQYIEVYVQKTSIYGISTKQKWLFQYPRFIRLVG